MTAHLDISTLEIRESPLKNIENDLRILLEKLKGERKKFEREIPYRVIVTEFIRFEIQVF